MESKKRKSWEIEKTRFFLNLIQERKIIKSLDGKKFRADEVFRHLESFMAEKGYNKTVKEMQTKFRNLSISKNIFYFIFYIFTCI